MAEKPRQPTPSNPEKPRTTIPTVGRKEIKIELKAGRARESLRHGLNVLSLKHVFQVLGFALTLDASGQLAAVYRRPESEPADTAEFEPRHELEHPDAETMRRDLAAHVGSVGLRELMPASSETQEVLPGVPDWEKIGVKPATARAYLSLGFPSAFRIPSTVDFSAVGETASVNEALWLVRHQLALSHDPRQSSQVESEARLAAWWATDQLLHQDDRPRSAHVESLPQTERPSPENINKLQIYFAALQTAVYDAPEPPPADMSWEQFKSVQIAERYDCSPAAAAKAVRLAQFWAEQFAPDEAREDFDWLESEKVRSALTGQLAHERTLHAAERAVSRLADAELRVELLALFEGGAPLPLLVVEHAPSSLQEALSFRNNLLQAAADLAAGQKHTQLVAALRAYDAAFRRLSSDEVASLHAYHAHSLRAEQRLAELNQEQTAS